MVILSAVQNGGLPLWVVGLVAAGGISAAFSTVSGMMLTGSASFAYDIYPRLIRANASENDKVYAAKGFFLVLAIVVMALTCKPWGLIAEIAALAFALAGNTIFPAFVLGIWWGRANATGVIAGMLCGVAITILPIVTSQSLPILSQIMPPTSSAFIGAPVVALIMIAVSLLGRPPSESIRQFLARDVHDCTEE
jgi:cation/acetate symporter